MVRTLYSFVMWLLQPLVRRKLLRRARAEPGYGEHIEERFGVYAGASHEVQGSKGHDASIPSSGCMPYRSVKPGGRAAGRRVAQSIARHAFVADPWHGHRTRARALAVAGWGCAGLAALGYGGRCARVLIAQPRIGLLVETEVSPNMAAACLARGIPLCLVNARMNEQSLARARRLAWLARPAYGALRAVWAQAQPDAERLAALGAPVRGVFGNFKFDATPDAQQWKTGRDWHDALGRPVAVLANSRDREELMFLESLKNDELSPT